MSHPSDNAVHGSNMDASPLVLQQSRIRKLPDEITSMPMGTKVRIGIPLESAAQAGKTSLATVGFPPPVDVGQAVLPALLGPVARRNANGYYIIHRDQPKELRSREAEFCWRQWCGGGDTEEVCRIVDIPYWRYPRTFVPPSSVELEVTANTQGHLLVVAREMVAGDDNELLKHTINLFLELFGTCQVLHSDLAAIVFPHVRKLNWVVLPKGQRSWESLKPDLDVIIQRASPKNRTLISRRLECINGYGANFVAVGRAGFTGYIVFSFPELHIFVLESIYFGNATYVLGSQWEQLSQMTKAQLLSEHLHLHRFVHRSGWENQIRVLLQRPPDSTQLAAAA